MHEGMWVRGRGSRQRRADGDGRRRERGEEEEHLHLNHSFLSSVKSHVDDMVVVD